MSNYMGLSTSMMTETTSAVAGEGEHASSGGLPQFDPSSWPSQIFWLAICFVVLYFVFSRVTLPRLSGIIETRRQTIEANMKDAENISAAAEQVKEAYEQSLKDAVQRASATVKAADDAAKAKLSEALVDFRERYDREVAATETRLAQSSSRAMEEMTGIAATIAAQAAEKIAGIPADQSQAESVVRSLSQKAKAA